MTSQDLSDAFGRPATASLRGLLPPRNGTNRWPEPPEPRRPPDDEDPSDTASPERPEDDDLEESEADELEESEADELDDTDLDTDLDDDGFEDREDEDDEPGYAESEGARPDRAERPRTAARRSTAVRRRPPPTPGTDRPRGRVRVTSREQADLLVLLSLRQGATDGRGVITRLRESSGGHLDIGEQTVYATLHRLTRNRLLGRVLDRASGRRFYALSKAGERSARARLRDWHALTICVDAVAGAGG